LGQTGLVMHGKIFVPMIGLKKRLITFLESLRFPWLLLVTLALFLVNVVVPDVIPFVDEILLALIAVVLARLKRKSNGQE
jgi:hypothetical protein